jgi:membrane protein
VFGALQDALNTIWEVAPRPGLSIRQKIRLRFMPLSLVLGTGFLLLVSLVVSAILAAVGTYFGTLLPLPAFVFEIINFIFSLAIISLLFALIFKFLPDAHIAWRDVWVGAIITSLLFVIGKMLIGLYLGNASVGSIYGTAGSLVVLLVWIYYSAQILFLGAEFTQVYANKFGSRIRPAAHAIPLTEPMRAEQGMTRTEPPRAPRSANAERTPTRTEKEPAEIVSPSKAEIEPRRAMGRTDGPAALLAVAAGVVVLYIAGRMASPRSGTSAPAKAE